MLEEDTTPTPDANAIPGEPAVAKPRPPRKPRRKVLDRATAGVAVLMALAGAGLYYMHWRTAPGVAAIDRSAKDAASVSTMLAGGDKSLAELSRSMKTTREIVDRIAGPGDATLTGLTPIVGDPFIFASLEPEPATTRPVDADPAARDEAKAKALAGVRQLQLQSIMYGTTRRSCLIDGKLYFEGQTVGDFTVARIAPEGILVQAGEFKFELRLRK